MRIPARHTFLPAAYALPVLFFVMFILAFGVNVLYADEWHNIPLFEKFYSGNLSLGDLTSYYYGHRLFVPKLITVLIGSLTGYNIIVELLIGAAFLIGSVFILWREFRVEKGKAALFIPVMLLMFSLGQWENIVLGVCSTSGFAALFFFVLATALLRRADRPGISFFTAVLSALLASFSIANGLACWLTGVFQLSLKKNKSMFLIWALIAYAVFWAYTADIIPAANKAIILPPHPAQALVFLAASLGNILHNPVLSVIAGAVVLCLSVPVIYSTIRSKDEDNMQYAALIIFSLAGAVMMSLGRSYRGTDYALETRFVTMMLPALAGIYLYFARSFTAKTRAVLPVVVLLSLTVYASGAMNGIKGAGEMKERKLEISRHLLNGDIGSLTMTDKLLPDKAELERRIVTMKRYRLNVFSAD